MDIRDYSEADSKRWNDYVQSSDEASCYHLTGWKNVIEKSFGHTAYYLLAEDGDAVVGILPLINMKSALFGNFIISQPYFNYGGICADNARVASLLMERAIEIARDVNAEHIELRHTRADAADLPAKTAKVSMRLSLEDGPAGLWSSFSSKLRNQVRRPGKDGMYSRIGKEEELDSFYQVFSVNMRDLGTPVYPKSFFSNIMHAFPDSVWICTIYTKGGIPVASGFLVGFKDRLEIPWASSLRSFNHLCPNMLMYWHAIQFASENGYRIFDFGRSTPGEGTYRFKKQWGAKPEQLYWHYWVRNGQELPELNPRNPKFRMAINIWKKMPVSLTRLIGPAIVRNLP